MLSLLSGERRDDRKGESLCLCKVPEPSVHSGGSCNCSLMFEAQGHADISAVLSYSMVPWVLCQLLHESGLPVPG